MADIPAAEAPSSARPTGVQLAPHIRLEAMSAESTAKIDWPPGEIKVRLWLGFTKIDLGVNNLEQVIQVVVRLTEEFSVKGLLGPVLPGTA